MRVDAVGMCFSDVKLIKQGGEHPKLYHRDLKTNPTRLGHEATLTVMKVGKNLQGQYHVGQRLALQPDIYDRDGRSTAYGYTIPGGLIQYHVHRGGSAIGRHGWQDLLRDPCRRRSGLRSGRID